jgi:hypothetical protein
MANAAHKKTIVRHALNGANGLTGKNECSNRISFVGTGRPKLQELFEVS